MNTIKHIFTVICCIVLSHSAYSADELYHSELSSFAYINIPFSGDKAYSSPTFSFTVTQTPTTDITSGISNDSSIFLNNPNRKALFDVQYNLAERQWSRFAFGGINSLVYDDVLYANGGGPGIDPRLVGLGIVGIVGIVISVNSNGDDDPHECSEGMTQIDPPTLNLHEQCEEPPQQPDPCEDSYTLNNGECQPD